MGFFNTLNISATGLTAERLRMDIISQNVSNANTTRTAAGTPYRRKVPIFKTQQPNTFDQLLSKLTNTGEMVNNGVEVVGIEEDMSPFKQEYNPSHPDADENGYVLLPNVNVVNEMINLISASRAYESNVTVINSAKSMAMKSLEIGR